MAVKSDSTLDGIALKNLENGRPPSSRIGDAAQCRTLVQQLIGAARERGRKDAVVQGMFDGNPPYSASQLRSLAQSNVTNVNFLEARALKSSALVPYYDLFSGSKYHAQLQVQMDAPSFELNRWSQIETEEFENLMLSWDGFDWHMQTMLNSFVGTGKGFLGWPRDNDWRFNVIRPTRVIVPDGTRCFLEQLEVMLVRQQYYIHELWGMVKNKAEARLAGWSTEEAATAISDAMPQSAASSNMTEPLSYEQVQDRIKDRDIEESTRSSVIMACHVFVKEFDGEISHYIISENIGKDPEKRKSRFLYEKRGKFEKFGHVVCPFFFETEDGSWNGACGLGHMLLSVMKVKDRLRGAAIDNAFLRSGITLQARDANSMQNTALVHVGRLNIIPPDFAVQQSSILGDVEGLLGVNRELDNLVQRNTGVYHVRGEKQEGNPITATQATLDMQQQVVLGNSAINRFMGTLDRFYEEIFRRVRLVSSKDAAAKNFVKACTDRGVPPEAFAATKVRSYRSIGNGSIYMRQQQTQALAPMVSLMSETGKSNWFDDVIAANTNQDMVDRYNPKPGSTEAASDHNWAAMLENAALKAGAPIPITESQNHIIHAQTHMQFMAQAMASVQQGANPGEVIQALEGIGPHVTAHLQQLSKNPIKKAEFKTLSQQWGELQATVDKFIKTILEQAQQAQESAPPADDGQPQTDPAVIKAVADSRIKGAKWEQQKTINEDKAKQKLAINDAMSAMKMKHGNDVAQMKIAHDKEMAGLKLEQAKNTARKPKEKE